MLQKRENYILSAWQNLLFKVKKIAVISKYKHDFISANTFADKYLGMISRFFGIRKPKTNSDLSEIKCSCKIEF